MNAPGAPAAPQSRLGAIVVIALLVASLVLGLLVYRARTPDLALEVPSFPKDFGGKALAEIIFFVRFDEEEATVEIVGRDQVVARTLAESIPLVADERIRCVWDGRDDEGEKAEPGRYRLRVTLPSEGRQMVFPKRLDIDATKRDGDGLVLSEPCGALEGQG
ncbi:MAG: hypothetical protein M3331_08770 [Actinomycetota bacterium]|nr:hypothetical protein [Actinomycetota bacterium]